MSSYGRQQATIKSSPPKHSRDPDLIHPGEKVNVPGQVPGKKGKQPAPVKVRQDLSQKTKQAVSGSGKPQSGVQDPISDAAQALTLEHKDDTGYLNVLAQVEPAFRRKYTRTQVQKYLAKYDIGGALQTLKTNMDATNSPAERQALYQAAGKPYFTRKLFENAFASVAPQANANLKLGDDTQNKSADAIGRQLLAWKTMPPEVTNTVLQAVHAKLPSGLGTQSGEDFYRGLSHTVEAADALNSGSDPGKATADWLIGNRAAMTADDTVAGNTRWQANIRAAVGNGDGAKLSVSVANELPFTPLKDAGVKGSLGPEGQIFQVRTQVIRSQALNGLAQGLGDLQQTTDDAVDKWLKQSGAVRFMLRNFRDPDHNAPGNPQSSGRADDAVAAYENKHTDKVATMNEALGNAGDAGAELSDAGQAALAMKGLNLDPAAAQSGEKSVADALNKINDDPKSKLAVTQSPQLWRRFIKQALGKGGLPQITGKYGITRLGWLASAVRAGKTLYTKTGIGGPTAAEPNVRAGMGGLGALAYSVSLSSAATTLAQGKATPSTYLFMGQYTAGGLSDAAQLAKSLPVETTRLEAMGRIAGRVSPGLRIVAAGLDLGVALRGGDKAEAVMTGTLMAGDAMTLASYLPLEAAAGPLGVVGAAFTDAAQLGLAAYDQYERIQASDQYEWEGSPDSPAIQEMVENMGFSEAQGKELFNQTKNGVSPMQALNQLAHSQGNSTRQMITYLQGLKPEQIHSLVAEAHHLLDNQMDDTTGALPKHASAQADQQAGTTQEVSIPDYQVPGGDKVTEIIHAKSLRGLGNWMKNQGMAFNLQPDPSQAMQSPVQRPSAPQPTPYVVKRGDNLWDVAWNQSSPQARKSALAQAHGNAVKAHSILLNDLLAANPVFDPARIGYG